MDPPILILHLPSFELLIGPNGITIHLFLIHHFQTLLTRSTV